MRQSPILHWRIVSVWYRGMGSESIHLISLLLALLTIVCCPLHTPYSFGIRILLACYSRAEAGVTRCGAFLSSGTCRPKFNRHTVSAPIGTSPILASKAQKLVISSSYHRTLEKDAGEGSLVHARPHIRP